jgi:hypothetical protein
VGFRDQADPATATEARTAMSAAPATTRCGRTFDGPYERSLAA